ncbi:hypothetical protein [Pseudoroseomonas cervicalis]|uniref:hypothetical protein n=1 Tax=Teichococcus cervicalis TaxID=204525 RepID=UPI0022F1C1F5|nr:hypothetical protein [Pseudoroseomonas cervicalis]WBV45426.1 hypothetical protein PFY06_20570 [Pseudoroseomonas cervicalis]
MNLSRAQVQAAQANGRQFLPADPAQVARLSMQRRIFWVEGQPCLAQREDGFLETAATLEHFLEEVAPAAAPPATAPDLPEASAPDPRLSEAAPVEAAAAGPETEEPAPATPADATIEPLALPAAELPASLPAGLPPSGRSALAETAALAAAYAARAQLPWQELPELIRQVHQGLARLQPAAALPAAGPALTPARRGRRG